MSLALYHNIFSGHSHRVRLFLSLLGLDYQLIAVDLLKQEQKSPDYLRINPLGQVPTLVDHDMVITDSTAALVYLAKKFDPEHYWLPEDPVGAAQVQVWLSTASGELYRGPATARAIKLIGRKASYDNARECALQLFQWMESVLDNQIWLVNDHVTIADIAMYSYIRIADEGELDITPYAAILTWLKNVESLNGFVAMERRK